MLMRCELSRTRPSNIPGLQFVCFVAIRVCGAQCTCRSKTPFSESGGDQGSQQQIPSHPGWRWWWVVFGVWWGAGLRDGNSVKELIVSSQEKGAQRSRESTRPSKERERQGASKHRRRQTRAKRRRAEVFQRNPNRCAVGSRLPRKGGAEEGEHPLMFDSTVAEPPNSMESRGGFGWVLSNAPVSAGASPQQVEDERKESHQGPRPFGRPKKCKQGSRSRVPIH